jgi:hypothetical protein
VFEHPTRDKMKRLVYERPGDDEMIVRVEGVGADGATSADVFRFTRVGDPVARPASRATRPGR